MYDIYNKDEIYYMQNMEKNYSIRIGNKEELIKYIANLIDSTDRFPFLYYNRLIWTPERIKCELIDLNYGEKRLIFFQNKI